MSYLTVPEPGFDVLRGKGMTLSVLPEKYDTDLLAQHC